MLKDKLATPTTNFAQFQGLETVADYGSPAAEYRAARTSVALMDRSQLGRIELTGADRVDLLQRISTNDINSVEVGGGLQTVLTTPEAKIIDLLTVYVKLDSLLCFTNPQNRAKVFSWFKRHIFFRDKVKPVDVSDQTVQLSLFGPRSALLLRHMTQQDLTSLPSYHWQSLAIGGIEALVGRVPYIAGGGYDLIAQAEYGETLWNRLLEAGYAFDLNAMGTTAFNWLRLEASQPLSGFELSEEYNPLEAGLTEAISFSKGCYTGQEVIARLDTYQKLKQKLVGLRLAQMPSSALPLSVQRDNTQVGKLTSAAQLPDQADVLGLGYVRIKFYQPGAAVNVVDGERGIAGILVELPWLKDVA